MVEPYGGISQPSAVSRPLLAVAGALVLAVATIVGAMAASAQDDVDRVDALNAEREELHERTLVAAEEIDVATASIEEVSAALDEINGLVQLQAIRVQDAERVVDAAQREADGAIARLVEVETRIAETRRLITEIAVTSFTGESAGDSDDMIELALSEDPGEAARFKHLLELHTGSMSDVLDELRRLEVEAAELVAVRDGAVADAEAGVEVVSRRSAELDAARERQAALVTAAETRLEARLAEAAALAERDAELAEAIRDEQQVINRRIRGIAREVGVDIPEPVDLADIVTLRFPDHRPDFSVEVHVDIAEATEALFIEAFEDGLDLGGFGYRPIQLQIELRAQHCGGTEEDIWLKPVADCAPPTARPGFSKHEQGRAIDFTFNGRSVSSQDSAAFQWLAAHAPRYGFVNLPEEPWHWSKG